MKYQTSSTNQPIISTKEELIEVLLENRGIKTAKEREMFFNPKLEDYQEDFKLAGIEIAKKRILQAIRNQELIIVYGDYDVDGICASAVIYLGLTSFGASVKPYIPHREKEGYGLSKIGLDWAKQQGAKLILTVDNGIVALEQAEYAKSLGLDLIITDHHLPLAKKPIALSIIHSTKMCGSAVAWCLIRQLVSENLAKELLDLVAIASICDLVPLLGVSRALTKIGLVELNKTKRLGLLALFQEAGVSLGEIGSYQVGYILGPRLNALGRMGDNTDALRLLCTSSPSRAYQLAKLINQTNDQKKQVTQQAISAALEMIDEENINHQKILVLNSPDWIPGIIGLVAGRVCEEYQRPAVIISQGQIESKGSARSVDGVDIVEVIRGCQDLLIDIGGHPKAAGFSIETTKIELFKARLNQLMESKTIGDTRKVIEAEGGLDLAKIDLSWAEEVETLAPFGIDNPKPVFVSFGAAVTDLRTVGSGGEHLKFKVAGVEAIGFSLGNRLKNLENSQVNLIYNLEVNKFNSHQILQLKVLDIQKV